MPSLIEIFTAPAQTIFKSVTGSEPNTYTHELDNLVLKSQRIKGVSQNKIWDYIQVENDPNFSRKNATDKYDKLISKLTLSQTILTVARGQLLMSRVHEFLPVNILNFLSDMSALSDTAVNVLSTFDSRLPLGIIENYFLQDLKIQFGENTITFNQLTNFAGIVIDSLAQKDDINNNGLRGILSLPIGSLIPEDLLVVFETAQWIDELNTIFLEDDANQYSNIVSRRVDEYTNNRIDEIITSSEYTNQPITYSDPYGLILRDNFISDIKTQYDEDLDGLLVVSGYALTDDQKNDLKNILKDDFNTKLDSVFESGNVGLPTLVNVSSAVETLSYNTAAAGISGAIDRLIEEIIIDVGLETTPANTRPLDYLVNVKLNISKRIEMERVGASLDAFTTIDNYLKTVVTDSNNINRTDLSAISDKIDELLNG